MPIAKTLLIAATLFSLAGCTLPPDQLPDASNVVIERAAYQHDGPSKLTLYTMINNRSGAGAHSSLMINGSQRVVFDPAGTVRFRAAPERGDVLFGITPQVADFYARAHARETYHVVIQELEVSPETAELALQLVFEHGRAAPAFCAKSTSSVLRQLPGFDGISRTFLPKRLMDDFERLPGVKTRRLYEDDDDDKTLAISQFERGY